MSVSNLLMILLLCQTMNPSKRGRSEEVPKSHAKKIKTTPSNSDIIDYARAVFPQSRPCTITINKKKYLISSNLFKGSPFRSTSILEGNIKFNICEREESHETTISDAILLLSEIIEGKPQLFTPTNMDSDLSISYYVANLIATALFLPETIKEKILAHISQIPYYVVWNLIETSRRKQSDDEYEGFDYADPQEAYGFFLSAMKRLISNQYLCPRYLAPLNKIWSEVKSTPSDFTIKDILFYCLREYLYVGLHNAGITDIARFQIEVTDGNITSSPSPVNIGILINIVCQFFPFLQSSLSVTWKDTRQFMITYVDDMKQTFRSYSGNSDPNIGPYSIQTPITISGQAPASSPGAFPSLLPNTFPGLLPCQYSSSFTEFIDFSKTFNAVDFLTVIVYNILKDPSIDTELEMINSSNEHTRFSRPDVRLINMPVYRRACVIRHTNSYNLSVSHTIFDPSIMVKLAAVINPVPQMIRKAQEALVQASNK